mgnify:CR=1 FL=1
MTIEAYPNDARTRPHASVTVDPSALGATTSGSDKGIVVFGSAEGGVPGALYRLTSFPQARAAFKGGELLDWIEAAWNPSNQEAGAGTIYAMRVDSAKQAELAVGNLVIKSAQYGANANQVNVRMDAGSIANSLKFTAIDAITGTSEVYDNLGPIFNIQYTGKGTAASAKVADGKFVVTVDGVDILNISLDNKLVSTADKLVDQINLQGDLVATMVPYGDKSIDSTLLDEAEYKDIKSTEATFLSVLGDLVLQTSASSNLVAVTKANANDVTLVPTVTANTLTLTEQLGEETNKAIEPFGLTPLSGGSNGTVPNSWSKFFTSFANDDAADAYYAVAVTPSQAIHGELSQFVSEMSASGYPLRAFVGGSLGESLQKTFTRRSILNNSRVGLVGFDAKVAMGDGRTVVFPAYMATAFVAGIASGLPVSEPVTFKHPRILELTRQMTSDQLDQLDANGVITVERVRGANSASFRIVSDRSTKSSSSDAVSTSMSLGETTDFLANGLREFLDDRFIGTRTTSSTAVDIKTAVSLYLGTAQLNGTVVTYDPANIAVVVRGDHADISFTATPSQGLRTIKVGIVYDNTAIEV